MKQELRNKDKGTAIERYRKSFMHAIDGFVYALKYEHNMIIIVICAVLAIFAGITFHISPIEWLFVILVIGLVMGSEMVNTAIEAVVDLETLEKHPLAKIAKDSASTATLIFSIVSFIGALIMFIPKLMEALSLI
jgi:undecaprenol kinase